MVQGASCYDNNVSHIKPVTTFKSSLAYVELTIWSVWKHGHFAEMEIGLILC